MKILSVCCLSTLLQLLVIQTYSQTNITNLSSGEAIFLHTDKSDYLAGDSIKFKAYILYDVTNLPKTISNDLYIAVLDQDGLEVAVGKFPVTNGQSEGYIELSDFLTEGIYLLIACTNTINGATPQNIFSEVIEVKKTEESEFLVEIKLSDSIYKPLSPLIANINFYRKGGTTVPASFTCKLTGVSGDLNVEKGKSGEDGAAIITIQLPQFRIEDSLKLFVTASYKGRKKTIGIILPTQYYCPG